MGGDGAMWGSVLQEKYASARAVACCPTMDLIAILTTDRHLLVHRTVSWQRILHVKQSDVFFTMETVAWSPDGMRLAVGCDDGELVMFAMATAGDDKGVEIKPHTDDDALRHATPIVAMHWAQLRDSDASGKRVSAPSAMLRNRTPSFLSGAGHSLSVNQPGNRTSVLVTADAAGNIGVWWNGVVLVAMIPLRDHFNTRLSGQPPSSVFTIHAVMLTTDLSALLVDVSHGVNGDPEGLSSAPPSRAVLYVDVHRSVQAVQCDLSVVSRVGYEVRSIFESVRASLRQIASEWKNATRVFELKMSLIGSLYEKYGCEEPPQVDMLAIVAGGIAPPALAQYFAQDIQEMSVIRMQKMFFSGCETIQTLSAKIKPGLQQVLFEVSELRGTVKWNHHVFRQTLGISAAELDAVIDQVGDLLAMMEQFEKIVQETRQDYSLFFTWLLERIRVHTNDASARPNQSTSLESANKSLLNTRRLVTFLECATQAAKEHQIKKNNNWVVEVTFGNQVSKVISSAKLGDTVSAVERQWSQTMAEMIRALSRSLDPSNIAPLNLGDDVDEVLLHSRCLDLPHSHVWNNDDQVMSDDEIIGDEEQDEGFDVLDAVDWDSLASIHRQKFEEAGDTSFLSMIAVRRGHSITFFTRSEGNADSEWIATDLRLNFLCGGYEECCGGHRMCLYGGVKCGKQEQLVVVDTENTGTGTGSIYLVSYESKFQRSLASMQVGYTSTQAIVVGAENVARRTLRNLNSTAGSIPTLSAQASRGVVCVVSGGVRLLVLDAEEGGDDEAGGGDCPLVSSEQENGENSDDHAEMDL